METIDSLLHINQDFLTNLNDTLSHLVIIHPSRPELKTLKILTFFK